MMEDQKFTPRQEPNLQDVSEKLVSSIIPAIITAQQEVEVEIKHEKDIANDDGIDHNRVSTADKIENMLKTIGYNSRNEIKLSKRTNEILYRIIWDWYFTGGKEITSTQVAIVTAKYHAILRVIPTASTKPLELLEKEKIHNIEIETFNSLKEYILYCAEKQE